MSEKSLWANSGPRTFSTRSIVGCLKRPRAARGRKGYRLVPNTSASRDFLRNGYRVRRHIGLQANPVAFNLQPAATQVEQAGTPARYDDDWSMQRSGAV